LTPAGRLVYGGFAMIDGTHNEREMMMSSAQQMRPAGVAPAATRQPVAEEPEPVAASGRVEDDDESVVEIPDIPVPSGMQAEDQARDTFSGAFNFAFIGAGQGGGRLAQEFWALGYRRVAAINTAAQDLTTIELPRDRKLLIGTDGAGKDPKVAARLFQERREDVLDLMRRAFGRNCDRVMVCVGSGGGTGSGTCEGLIELAREYMRAIGREPRVGVLVATPRRSESRRTHENSRALMERLEELSSGREVSVSPMIRLDNERIDALYPGLPVCNFWSTANRSVASLFHLFNTISVKDSPYTAFDRADYLTVLDSGQLVFGAMPVENWKDETAIAYAVRENLKRTVLAGDIDVTTGKIAAVIVVAGRGVFRMLPQKNLEHAFEQLSRILRRGNTVHHGIYVGRQEALVVYTMIGGIGGRA